MRSAERIRAVTEAYQRLRDRDEGHVSASMVHRSISESGAKISIPTVTKILRLHCGWSPFGSGVHREIIQSGGEYDVRTKNNIQISLSIPVAAYQEAIKRFGNRTDAIKDMARVIEGHYHA